MNFTQFPRRGYLQGETPIESMKNLSKVLGGKVNLFIKRDDLLPSAAGGNKTRKLDFCIADALEKGADTIVSKTESSDFSTLSFTISTFRCEINFVVNVC